MVLGRNTHYAERPTPQQRPASIHHTKASIPRLGVYRKETMPRQYRKDALLIFCLLAFVYSYFYQDGGYNGNSRFGLIFAMVRERRLTIDSFHNKTGTKTLDKSYFNGQYYSDKAIGPSLVGAFFYIPMYWIKQTFNRLGQSTAKIILTFLVIGLPSAIAGSLLYILCLYLSRSRLRAFLVTLIITLGTMYFPYSISFFSHQFTSALLFSAFFMLFFLKEKPEIWKNWYFFLIGLLLGMALISEYPSAVIILALLFYYFTILWRNPTYHHFYPIGLTMVGGAIPVLLQLINNKLSFGNWFSIGYANLSNPYFNSSMGQGLMGIHWPNLRVLFYMTFHPTMGLFWQSPVLIFSIIGAIFLFIERRYRIEAILAMWIIGTYLVIMSGYYMWWGGHALGPRHIIPILPFFCILLVFVPKRLNWPLVVLGAVSIGQMIFAAASNIQVPDTMVEKINTLGFFEYSNIYNYCLKQLIQGNFTRNLGLQYLGLKSWSSLIPLLVVLAGGIFYFIRNTYES
jgi:hypothetical protein